MEREHARRPISRDTKIAAAAGLLLAGSLAWVTHNPTSSQPPPPMAHHNITTTVFWVGEPADPSNAYIHNSSSTWVENWQDEFGGVDDPSSRCNTLPCDFTPHENPFYFALPYNDLDQSCQAKPSQADVPWFTGPPNAGESIIKNQWIKIQFAGRVAFAQWEDAGPLGEDDTAYVFGDEPPNYEPSGLDISPATAEYLQMDGRGQTSWQFVAEKDVPDGPWRQTITTSLPDCAR